MIRLSGLVTLPAINSVGRTKIEENSPTEMDPENLQPEEEGRMAKAKLMNVYKNSSEIYNMLSDNEDLEPWVQDKITKAADYITSVHDYLQYEKSKPASIGQGDGFSADDRGTSTMRTVRTV